MIKYTDLPTVTRYCKTCQRETEQSKTDGSYICLSCLMNPETVLQPDKKVKQGKLL